MTTTAQILAALREIPTGTLIDLVLKPPPSGESGRTIRGELRTLDDYSVTLELDEGREKTTLGLGRIADVAVVVTSRGPV